MDFNFKIALRDSDTATRSYVIVNPMLAKHLPCKPCLALDYFSGLGGKIAEACKGERVLVIGFAETATAAGAAVAGRIEGAVYVHTTRESFKESNPQIKLGLSIDFFEEHSHAKNQSLYLLSRFGGLSLYDRIVFVEDEITTGRTIINFLKHIEYSGKITVSALIFNGLDESVFSNYNADFFCLQRVDKADLALGLEALGASPAHKSTGDLKPSTLVSGTSGMVKRLRLGGIPNPRGGVIFSEYYAQCMNLALGLCERVDEADIRDKNILVIGTEEFMFPALVAGRELERMAKSVKFQATTRSPLLPLDKEGYPFYSRCEFSSVYSSDRISYLYNLEKYDTVVMITDAPDGNDLDEGDLGGELMRAVQSKDNKMIYYARVKDVF
ncbi:MAG: phosphoribosyltransferase family protein [Oscillospiraceae bacterium]|nr:phosphoribosyltransferase family protein [Oscillospiraceae bacterium]